MRAAQALLVLVGELHVLPHARRLRACRRTGSARRRTRCRASRARTPPPPAAARSRGRPTSRARPACTAAPMPYGSWPPCSGWHADRVAQDLARQLGLGVDHRQQVVRPAPRAEVQAGRVLVVAALRDRVVRRRAPRRPRPSAAGRRPTPARAPPTRGCAPKSAFGSHVAPRRASLAANGSGAARYFATSAGDLLAVRHPVGVAQRHRSARARARAARGTRTAWPARRAGRRRRRERPASADRPTTAAGMRARRRRRRTSSTDVS